MEPESNQRSGRAAAALRDYVRWYDDVLPKTMCDRLIGAFTHYSEQHVRREAGWRAGLNDSAWTELDITPLADDDLKSFFFRHIEQSLAKYNSEVGLSMAVPNSSHLAEFRMKRYRPDSAEKFQLHFDSINEVSDRFLVFLWYLNDVEQGGETEFPDLGVKVPARAGRLVMFPPYWMFQHAGLPPLSGEKYILSTYMLFPRN